MAFRHALFVFPPRGCVFSPQMAQNPQNFRVRVLPQNTLHATLCQSSHGIHRIHRNFWRKIFSHRLHGCAQIRRVWHPCHTHATLCQSSHGIHRIHRNFWRRRASHGFRRCPQMVRLRKVLWLLWEDSLVSAWVWQDAIPSYNCTDWGLKFCVFCAIRGRISQKEISVRICVICGRISQQEVSVNSVNSVGGCSGCLVEGVSKLPYSKKITKP